MVPGGIAQSQGKPGACAATSQAATALLRALSDPGASRQEVDVLLDELSDSQLPFREELLGGGPWRVVYTRGSLLLWEALQRPATALSRANNAASQDLDPLGRTVVNKAEFWGARVYVTASGTYSPQLPEQPSQQQQEAASAPSPLAWLQPRKAQSQPPLPTCPVPVSACIERG
eukprot:CAMPEP_0202872366 /NCGR_PEP_ID=MMETSP1391-20130828/21038_1 /ASSEMBLY_ACC=CAM_ASM_000867 /TAXON_ID=1034604 /ORGANISM="Chlamydomonas leiostraca, Strain SAG 11-49" /LENGTH=173 /DNA_ID=CAMNT_0049553391 /DNA_START=105 /DNA_END=623 /DNA_ORIENTATION=+